MNRPDEIAALAADLEKREPFRGVIPSRPLTVRERDIIVSALRLSATSPGDAVRAVLRAHWLHQIVCNHEDGTDKPYCSCSMWNCPPQLSIGAAVEAWIDHVIEHLTKPHVENASLPGHDWQLSDETKAHLKAIDDHQRASAATISTMICGSAALAPAEKAGGDLSEVERLLRKISDLAYDEDACEPLDDAISYANKALAVLTGRPAEDDGSFDPPNPNDALTDQERDVLEQYLASRRATPTPPSADVERCPDGVNPEAYAKASPEHKAWLRNEIPMNDKLFDEIMGIQSAALGGGTVEVGPFPGEDDAGNVGIAPRPSDLAQEPEAVALKPCPFCKASPHKGFGKVHHDQLHGEPQQDFSIWCPKGHAKVTRVNAGQAAEEWNTRPVSLDREAVKRAICKSRTCEGIRCCQWPCSGGRWHDDRNQPGACRVEEGRYDDAANEVLALIEGRT